VAAAPPQHTGHGGPTQSRSSDDAWGFVLFAVRIVDREE